MDPNAYPTRATRRTVGETRIAPCDISAGSVIFSEYPLMVGKDPTPIEIYQMVERLSAKDRAVYYNLWCPENLIARPRDLRLLQELLRPRSTRQTSSNVERATQLQVFTQILQRTNWDAATGKRKIACDALKDYEGAARLAMVFWNCCFDMLTGNEISYGIFPQAAHLNHSCIPNCQSSWNSTQGQLCVFAIRNIVKDEQLLIMYDANQVLFQNRICRMLILRERYGFDCACPACDLSTDYGKQGEPVRNAIADLTRQIACTPPPQIADSVRCAAYESLYLRLLTLLQSLGLQTVQKAKVHIDLARALEAQSKYARAALELSNAKTVLDLCVGGDHQLAKQVFAALDRVSLKIREASGRHATQGPDVV